MPRTHGRIKVAIWDVGSEFRHLSIEAQWAYQMLLSQPGLTMCGTLTFAPKKWAKLASALAADRLEAAVRELEEAWYVIVDRDSDELLIRTFVKHDEPWRLLNLVKAARTQFRAIESEPIRDYLRARHEWIVDETMDAKAVEEYEERRASEGPSERTLPMDMSNAHSNAHSNRAHPRTDVASPGPVPAPKPLSQRENRTAVRGNGLPVEKERLVVDLIAAVGEPVEEADADSLRSYAAALPEGAIAKVLESLKAQSVSGDRLRYAFGALLSEKREFAGPFDDTEPDLEAAP